MFALAYMGRKRRGGALRPILDRCPRKACRAVTQKHQDPNQRHRLLWCSMLCYARHAGFDCLFCCLYMFCAIEPYAARSVP
jgi:hypothetical protein